MEDIPGLVKDLALILVVAGAVTLLFKKLKQPLVLGYLVAGFLVSPHMPYTMSVVDQADIKIWANIGVMFLLFSLGLDFSFKKILKMGMQPVIATLTIVFCMIVLGVTMGKIIGWGRMDCIFLGGMLAMSSTTIIYKALGDLGLRQQRFAGMVMSVLILEDILAIVMMVMLSAIAGGGSPDGGRMLGSVLKTGFFLVLWFVVGIYAIPLFLRSVRRLIDDETLLVLSLGLCCAMAVISTKVGFSSAFGAFVMGSILAETVEADKIIKIVESVKNLFGAIFFVSVGMLVDPHILVDYAVPILLLVLTILAGQATFGTFGFLISGQTLKSAMQCGFSMAQIGEFSFIIASLGLSLGVIGEFVYPVVVAVSVITTFLTPYMIRASGAAYNIVERHMPGTWILTLNRITLSHPASGEKSLWHKLLASMLRTMLIYGILSAASIALMFTFVLPFVRGVMPGWGLHWYANAITGLLTVLLISPFLRSIVVNENHRKEARQLWGTSRINRFPLIFTALVRVAFAASFIFYIINYLSRFANALIITVAVVIVVLMTLSRRLRNRSARIERTFIQNLRSRDIEAEVTGQRRPLYEGRLLDRDMHIGSFDIPEDSLWAGRTLRDLQLRNRFGVHVSSILRGKQRINIPSGATVICPADKVHVIGSDEQLKALEMSLNDEVFRGDPDIEKREMKLKQMLITETSQFVGKTLKESGIRDKYNCMVVGLERGEENLLQPSPEIVFAKGDIVWIVGEEESLRQAMQ